MDYGNELRVTRRFYDRMKFNSEIENHTKVCDNINLRNTLFVPTKGNDPSLKICKLKKKKQST